MASEKAPEYGAIFMSNRTTIGECFERNLVGLPLHFADFVKEIRAGMVLFIFEYVKRKLHGVLKAVTDGRMNIEPNAYRSSGKLFPAQVRFEVIWRCDPLREDEFQDAIGENYFATNKFSFGLSKKQVQDLLGLFLSKNPRIQRAIRESTIKKQTPSEEKPDSVWSLDFIPLSSSPGNDSIEDLEETVEDDDQMSSAISPQNGRPKVKGLYLDSPGERGSVFSRLVAASKPAVEEKIKSVPSLSEIMEDLEKLHGTRWKKRTTVFDRLKFGSKDSVEDDYKKEVNITDNNNNKSTSRGDTERFQTRSTRKRSRENMLGKSENIADDGLSAEERWRMFRDGLAQRTSIVQVPFSSSGKENVERSFEGSTGSNRTDDDDDDYTGIVPAFVLQNRRRMESLLGTKSMVD